MSSGYYGTILSGFWTGETGRALRKQGGKDAQLLGVYLFSNPYMNMVGLYPLKLRDVRDDIDLSPAQLTKTFAVMRTLEYAFYDYATGFVWVKEMATFRLSIKDNEPLDKKDKRAIGAQKLYGAIDLNPWLSPFFDRYGKLLHLKTRRDGLPAVVAPEGPGSASLDLRRGLARGSDARVQIQIAGIQGSDPDPDPGTSSAAVASQPAPPAEDPKDNYGVIEKIAHEVLRDHGFDGDDLIENISTLCARRHIAYNSTVVKAAARSAEFQRGLVPTV